MTDISGEERPEILSVALVDASIERIPNWAIESYTSSSSSTVSSNSCFLTVYEPEFICFSR